MKVEDTELNDYVEDYLTEQWDLEPEYLKDDTSVLPHLYTHHFSNETNLEALLKALRELNPQELEKIFRLNNK